jgi:hypothetical protein
MQMLVHKLENLLILLRTHRRLFKVNLVLLEIVFPKMSSIFALDNIFVRKEKGIFYKFPPSNTLHQGI